MIIERNIERSIKERERASAQYVGCRELGIVCVKLRAPISPFPSTTFAAQRASWGPLPSVVPCVKLRIRVRVTLTSVPGALLVALPPLGVNFLAVRLAFYQRILDSVARG